MITLYSWFTPNPKKVVMLLEELSLPYTEVQVDPTTDAVRAPDVLEASPNAKIPAIVDDEGPGGETLRLFESGAILIYLAEKAGSDLLPIAEPARSRVMQWLMWQMAGVGPMIGQYFHFKMMAPEPKDYAVKRYEDEMHRLLTVLDTRLAEAAFVAGPDYSIADIAIYAWIALLAPVLGVDLSGYANLNRWQAAIAARPATQRAFPAPEGTS